MANETEEQQRKVFDAILQEYQRKWDIVIQQQQHIYGNLAVAEALWGDELYIRFKGLFEQTDTLHNAIRGPLRIINPDIPDEEAVNINNPAASHRKYRDMLSIAFFVDGNDVFGEKIMEDIKSIEQYLKKKLKMIRMRR